MNEKSLFKFGLSVTGGLIDSIVPGLGSGLAVMGSDFSERQLSNMESDRICYVIEVANKRISENINSGCMVRDDDFFRHRAGVVPSVQELAEGVLVKAKNEHIEKKNYHLGLFFGDIPFRLGNKEELNFLLNLFTRLTYRQMIILHLFERLETPKNKEKKEFWTDREFNPVSDQHPSFSAEIMELRSIGLLKGLKSNFSNYIEIANLGRIFAESFHLHRLFPEDIESITNRILNPSSYYRLSASSK